MSTTPDPPAPAPRLRQRRIVGVSTKMYFSAARTASFVNALLTLLAAPDAHPLLDTIDIFIVPDHVALTAAVAQVVAAGQKVLVGAQNCHAEDAGAFTGEVSPAVLAEVGCALVELGHAERRRLFGETDASTAGKAAAVVRNGMVPLVCVGEVTRGGGVAVAVEEVLGQVRSVLEAVPEDAEVVLAYEPVWAIGASEPAPVGHVCEVVRRVRESEEVKGREGATRIVYGGSAGPGLFARLGGEVDGLFLGRFAHDPGQFYKTLCEVAEAPRLRES
ncbi:triosephosphate isomerase [Lasiosphaeria hispida]|uniref:Triosephosphate isomerase n=1 Tax=Lasiosphaeria hispida TaxID=260671 RepID=A0AAJ0HI86_9PEZI|nr:triosephosphate isomerase [Lasiosphaeria hispida]